MTAITTDTLKRAAAELGANWLDSALQMGVMDGAAGRPPIPPPDPRKRAWSDLYDRAYQWARAPKLA